MSWLENVAEFFDTLAPVAAQVRKRLEGIRHAIAVTDNEALKVESVELGILGEELKRLFQRRWELLRSAPIQEAANQAVQETGTARTIDPVEPDHVQPTDERKERLLVILDRFEDAEARELIHRGRRLEQLLRENQTLAQSIFVAEYHLIQSAQDVLAILTGHAPFQHPCEPSPLHPGCVLDRAA